MSAKSTRNKEHLAPASSEGEPRSPRPAGASAQSSAAADGDVAFVCGVSGDGQGVDIIRKRGDRVETGTVRRLEQGKPIHGEVVRLRQRENAPRLYDVEVEIPAQAEAAPAPSTSGPAQVATESYRKNWDAVYGRSRKPSLLN